MCLINEAFINTSRDKDKKGRKIPSLKSPFNRVAIEENIPISAGISLTTSNVIEFLKDTIGITEQNLLDTAAHALFAHWQTSRYTKFGKTHTFHETMFAKETFKEGNEDIGNKYIREKLNKYPVEEMSRVLGWNEDYQKYVVQKQIMEGSYLRDQMKELHDDKNRSRKIKPLANTLDKYKEWKGKYDRMGDKTKKEANKGIKILNKCREQVWDYVEAHKTNKVDSSRVTWLRIVFKPMLDQQNSELKSSLKDKNNKKQSDSEDGLRLLVQDNSKSLEVNEEKFYSLINPTLEVSPDKAVISAKAAGATGKSLGHTIIYIEYFASPDDIDPTILTTELRGNFSSSRNSRSRSLFLDTNIVDVTKISVIENREKIAQYEMEYDKLEKEYDQGRKMYIEKSEQYNNSLTKNPKDEEILEQLIQKAKEIVEKLTEKEKELKVEKEKVEKKVQEVNRYIKTSQTVKSWAISRDNAINAVKKAYQVQEEVEIDNTKDQNKAQNLKQEYAKKYGKDYQGYKYSVTGGRHLFNLFSQKKLMNCARYGAKILKAAGVKGENGKDISAGKFIRTPKTLAPRLKY